MRRVLICLLTIAAAGGALALHASSPAPGGEEQTVNSTLEGPQSTPTATARLGRGFVVSWSSIGGPDMDNCEDWEDCPGFGIHARRFDRAGQPQGTEFRANTSRANFFERHVNPALAQDPAGNFVVVWNMHLDDCCQYGGGSLYMRPFLQDGTPVDGSEQLIDTFGRNPDVAKADDGSFVVVWERGYVLKAQRFATDGTPLNTVVDVAGSIPDSVPEPQVGIPAVASRNDGTFVVAWTLGFGGYWVTNGIELHGQRLAADGSLLGDVFPLSSAVGGQRIHPDIATSSDGSFLVVWQATEQEGDGLGVFARKFLEDGNPVAPEIRVNQFATGDQVRPQVAVDDNGGFVVSWASDGQDGDGKAIVARNLSPSGVPVGDEFLINAVTAGSQFEPAIAHNQDGDLLVAWTTEFPVGQPREFDVAAQFFRPAELFVDGFESGSTANWSAIDP